MSHQENVRVLIAENDYLVSKMIEGLLEKVGYTTVGVAADGLETVEMTRSLRPDIVLMDIKMPVMDGIEATRHIYESCPTPVVILSAYDMPELLERASMAGVGAYLVKPPNRREIERAIAIAMARFDDVMELRRLNAELQTINQEREKLILELKDTLGKIKTLSGLLPICASCKKIRDDQGYWHQVEVYMRDHSEAKFTHGLCPDCKKKLYPEVFKDDE